jgi:mitochondrial fission protein ELM1
MSVWGLVDDRTGHTGQVLGVIGKLGLPYILKRLEYNKLAALPNLLLGSSLLHIDSTRSAPITSPWPKLIIAAGRRTLPVLRYIKHRSPTTIAVYSGWPESMQGLDLIAAPEHDQPPTHANVVTTLAPLHAVTKEILTAAKAARAEQFAHFPKPWVAVFLGGKTKKGDYAVADWHHLLQYAQRVVGSGTLMVTTSRRTPPEAVTLFSTLLTGPHVLHRWDTDKDNPYLGILGSADAVIVTGDSLSMCAEACVSGKPVYIFTVPQVVPTKHKQLHEKLYARGIARPLDLQSAIDWQPDEPLDDVGRVVAEIINRFPQALSSH